MLEKISRTYINLALTKIQIKFDIKQINFIVKTCNYTKEYKLLGLNSR